MNVAAPSGGPPNRPRKAPGPRDCRFPARVFSAHARTASLAATEATRNAAKADGRDHDTRRGAQPPTGHGHQRPARPGPRQARGRAGEAERGGERPDQPGHRSQRPRPGRGRGTGGPAGRRAEGRSLVRRLGRPCRPAVGQASPHGVRPCSAPGTTPNTSHIPASPERRPSVRTRPHRTPVRRKWLRRQHRWTDARVPHRSALESFERLGAKSWADRAASELRATGESLTSHADDHGPFSRVSPRTYRSSSRRPA
jgi:hypothetical protein